MKKWLTNRLTHGQIQCQMIINTSVTEGTTSRYLCVSRCIIAHTPYGGMCYTPYREAAPRFAPAPHTLWALTWPVGWRPSRTCSPSRSWPEGRTGAGSLAGRWWRNSTVDTGRTASHRDSVNNQSQIHESFDSISGSEVILEKRRGRFPPPR